MKYWKKKKEVKIPLITYDEHYYPIAMDIKFQKINDTFQRISDHQKFHLHDWTNMLEKFFVQFI